MSRTTLALAALSLWLGAAQAWAQGPPASPEQPAGATPPASQPGMPGPTADTGEPTFVPAEVGATEAPADTPEAPGTESGTPPDPALEANGEPTDQPTAEPADEPSREPLVAEDPPAALLRPPDAPLVAEDPPAALERPSAPPPAPLEAGEPPAALALPPESPVAPAALAASTEPAETVVAPAPQPLDRWLPSLARHGVNTGLIRFALAVLALVIAALSRRGLARLPERGLLPFVLRSADGLGRLFALALILAGLAALLPPGLLPAVTWVIVAAALALGWSARDVLADGVAGIVLQGERGLAVGHRAEGEGFAGAVQHVGLRSTRLLSASGQQVTVPNRRLTSAVITTDPRGGVPVTVTLSLPEHLPAEQARAALREAALAAPWVSATTGVDIGRDATRPHLWTLRVDIIEGRFESRFSGTLRDRVDLALSARGLSTTGHDDDAGVPP